MFKSYKTELNPTPDQIKVIENYFKICTVAYNRYLTFNVNRIKSGKKIIMPSTYLADIKNGRIKDLGSEFFVKNAYNTAVKKVLENALKVLNAYSQGKAGEPKLKALGTKNISLYFSATSINQEYIECQRHRINIPFFGWIRLKEKGYIPTGQDNNYVISGWIKKCAGRYYVSALVKEDFKPVVVKEYNEGIGIDLNVTNFATISDGTVFDNINKSKNMVHLRRKLHRKKLSLGRKNRAYRVREGIVDNTMVNMISESSTTKSNYFKNRSEIEAIYHRMNCIRNDYIRQCINQIVNKNPKFVAVEDLKITDMVSDRRFAKYVADEHFYQFKLGLYKKCKERGIEFRVINHWYPSTRQCHDCGYIVGSKISVNQREFVCPKCGSIIPRDLNASLNIRDAKDYVVWKS